MLILSEFNRMLDRNFAGKQNCFRAELFNCQPIFFSFFSFFFLQHILGQTKRQILQRNILATSERKRKYLQNTIIRD